MSVHSDHQTQQILKTAYAEGTIFRAAKEMFYGGATCKPGDPVVLTGGRNDEALVRLGFVITDEIWQERVRQYEAAEYRKVLDAARDEKRAAAAWLEVTGAALAEYIERDHAAERRFQAAEAALQKAIEEAPELLKEYAENLN